MAQGNDNFQTQDKYYNWLDDISTEVCAAKFKFNSAEDDDNGEEKVSIEFQDGIWVPVVVYNAERDDGLFTNKIDQLAYCLAEGDMKLYDDINKLFESMKEITSIMYHDFGTDWSELTIHIALYCIKFQTEVYFANPKLMKMTQYKFRGMSSGMKPVHLILDIDIGATNILEQWE